MRFILAALLALPGLAGPALAADLSVERLFDAPDLQGPSLRGLAFSPDGRLVSYLKGREDDASVYDLWSFELATGRHRRLVDSRLLVADEKALAPEEEARRERQRIAALRGIVEYSWSPDSRALLFPLGGDLYHYDLGRPAGSAVRRLTATAEYETDSRFSPLGRYVSFIRDQDIHAIELATGRELRLTRGGGGLVSQGVAEFIAQEEMDRNTGYWWSPDESRVAFARVDETRVDEVERYEVNADGIRVLRQRYPAAGRPNAVVMLGVVALAGGEVSWCDLGEEDHYLARVNWFPDSEQLLVQRQARDQRRLDLLRFDAGCGAGTLLFTEQSGTWVELHDDLHFVAGQRKFLWASQRSGHNHLYLYDYDGRLLRPVTAGNWDVDGDRQQPAVRGIDAARGRVYFMATLKTPLERHLHVASLRGGTEESPRQLSAGDGWNSVTMPPDARHYLLSYSDPMQPPQLSLHAANGRRLAWLAENRLAPGHPYWPYIDRHVPPEFGALAAPDGSQLYWQMHRPPAMEPGRRYPAIVVVYGGPGVQQVQRRWGDRRGGQHAQLLAQRGYVVFSLDNRGSSARGSAFATALHGRLGSVEVEDQLRGIGWLQRQSFVDPARIGVYGWSYGGYMTLKLMAAAPGIVAAGVSGAPVTDWRLYDTHYTERFMGTPAENAGAYLRSGALGDAARIQGRLLLMHGMADDNVLFTHTTMMIARLVAEGRQFEVLPYPGGRHAVLSFSETGRHGWNAILDFFDRSLAP